MVAPVTRNFRHLTSLRCSGDVLKWLSVMLENHNPLTAVFAIINSQLGKRARGLWERDCPKSCKAVSFTRCALSHCKPCFEWVLSRCGIAQINYIWLHGAVMPFVMSVVRNFNVNTLSSGIQCPLTLPLIFLEVLFKGNWSNWFYFQFQRRVLSFADHSEQKCLECCP